MTAFLQALSGRARLAAAGGIIAVLVLTLLAPVGLGAASLVGAMQRHGVQAQATARIEARLDDFTARRAAFANARDMSTAELEAYFNGGQIEAEFQATLITLAEALRARGIAASGELRVRTNRDPNGVTRLTADLTVAGPLAAILTVLSDPQFAQLNTEFASFAAEAATGEVRGALRLVAVHVGIDDAAEGDDAR
jgi:hypothetical protein